MRVTFLEAKMPLTKKFTATSKEPYPNAYEFKSHTETVGSLSDFAALIQRHADQGHCLLKGELQKDLDWESRAGSTDPNKPTRWACLDIDGIKSVSNIDAFMLKIGLSDVSYILQWSASYGVNNDFTLRAHVFVLFAADCAPSALKLYLKQQNLTNFKDDLSLTKTDVALKWGLDITTCQNDKLIFITPPQCVPATIDMFQGKRISLVKKAKDFVDFDNIVLLSAETLKQHEEAEINRLRKQANLPEKKASQFRYKEFKGEQYLPNPDQATVTGVKEERGFVYLNLNGGNSWGYYHPADNPTFIYNFKGEPTYRTSELVPDYWASLQAQKRQAVRQAQQGKLFFAFREFTTATYYNGWYDQTNDELTLHQAKSERQLEDFMIFHGQPVPDAIPIWSIVYDPNLPVVDITSRTVNVFKPSYYMSWAKTKGKLVKPKPTPTIDRLITHVFGASAYDRFFNWLAFSFQYRTAPKTAWVAHGTQGTGKGVLVNLVIAKLFGSSNVAQRRMEELEDKFNPYLENTLICVIDEAQISDSGRSKMIMANLKNQITEPTITIRRMRQSAYETTNRVGFIFNSNKPDPVVVEAGDRRFNVGEYQPTKIELTEADLKAIDDELLDFAFRLWQHTVDVEMVRTPMVSEAKKEMQMASRTSADVVADAITQGDLSVFWDALPTGDVSAIDPGQAMKLQPYKNLIYDLVLTRRNKLTRDELRILFDFNVGKVPSSPIKFTMFVKHHGLNIVVMRLGAKVVRGVPVEWANDDEWFAERTREIEIERTPKSRMKVVASAPQSDQPSNNAQATPNA